MNARESKSFLRSALPGCGIISNGIPHNKGAVSGICKSSLFNKEGQMNAGQKAVRPLEVSMNFDVKPYDIDFMGIVSNITYVRWIEDLRMKFLETHYALDLLMKDGHVPIIQSTLMNYRRPIRMFDQVKGCIWMDSFDSPSWTAGMEITVNEKLAASATQSGVFISIATMKPSTVPERLQAIYDDALDREHNQSGVK
jgi:acyl-CoA thioester hydrolase